MGSGGWEDLDPIYPLKVQQTTVMIIKISSKVRAFFVFINILASCQSAVAAVALEGESQLQVRSILPEPSLYQDFQTYIRFSYAAGCNETIIEKVFPLGSDWDKLYPSEMVKSAYSANTTGAGYLALNHQLKAIIVSFRGTATKQLWYQGNKQHSFYHSDLSNSNMQISNSGAIKL